MGFRTLVGFEACSSGDGGLVDPVPGDGLGQDVGCSFAFAGNDVGVVGVPAAGQRRVEAAAVDGAVDEKETGVDGAALGGVAGLGVTELEVLSDVIGGEPDTAGASGAARRRAGDGCGDEFGLATLAGRVADEPQANTALGNQRVAGGQKREAERPREARDDDLDPDAVLFGRLELEWSLTQVGRREAQIRPLAARLVAGRECGQCKNRQNPHGSAP